MQDQSFFRPEAVAHRLERNMGSVSILMPIHLQWMSLIVLLLLVLIILYISFARVALHIELKGYIDVAEGVLRFYPAKSGTLTKRYVKEGMHVQKAMPLFAIQSSSTADAKASLLHLNRRLHTLIRERTIARSRFNALKSLHRQHYVSLDAYQAAELKFLDCQSRLRALKRELVRCRQSLHSILFSPIDGLVTNISAYQGQFVDGTKPLLQIIPADALFYASLIVPARYIAQIKKGSVVELHYDAFPASHYGSYQAVIENIHQSILIDTEDSKPITISEPYYKVDARLIRQDVLVDGKSQSLRHGLGFTAHLRGEPRYIWQWILAPLYRLQGSRKHASI